MTAFFQLVGSALRAGHTKLAKAIAAPYFVLRPRDVRAWLRWQKLLASACHEEERLFNLQQTLSRNPDKEEVWGVSAWTKIRGGQMRQAHQQLKEMRLAFPGSVLPHLLEIELAHAEGALEHIRPAIQEGRAKVRPHLEPNYAARLGIAMLDENIQTDAALELISDAVRWGTDEALAHAVMSFVEPAREREHFKNARSHWDPEDGDLGETLDLLRSYLERRGLIGRLDAVD